jgi:hypothetical protein
MTLSLLLLIVAFVLALLAAFGVSAGRVGLFPLAFAVFILASLVGGVRLG